MIIAVLTGTTLKEPERQSIGEDSGNQENRKKVSLYKVLTQPRVILLAIAASIRHCGGMVCILLINFFPFKTQFHLIFFSRHSLTMPIYTTIHIFQMLI